MNYIVLDLEWNQSYRGKEYSIEEMPFEIIQIGAVKLDEHKNITGRWERIIRPVEYVKCLKLLKMNSKWEMILQVRRKNFLNGVVMTMNL